MVVLKAKLQEKSRAARFQKERVSNTFFVTKIQIVCLHIHIAVQLKQYLVWSGTPKSMSYFA